MYINEAVKKVAEQNRLTFSNNKRINKLLLIPLIISILALIITL